MYDTVLLPTEAETDDGEAIELALDAVERYGAELHVLYVVEDPNHRLVDVPAGNRRQELSSAGEEAIGVVERAARDRGVPVNVRVGVGEPEVSIPEHIKRVPAEFVVMGTHGRTGVERLLVGSVAETVVRHADVPVLVVPLPDPSIDD